MDNLKQFSNNFFSYINFYDLEFMAAVFMIIICPITWNLVARWEFYTKIFSKLAGDNRLAADIFAHILIEMGLFRNYMFSRTVQHQSHFDIDASLELYLQSVAFLTFGSGVLFVLGSFYRLGIHGIYYADYFGILMSEKATRFPYNVLENPLYVGSTLIFLGSSIHYKSPVGFILTLLAFIMYKFASILENPITELIYSEENIKSVRKMSKERERKGSIDRNLK